jgi:Heterokaryon incompatibility protein (HET)
MSLYQPLPKANSIRLLRLLSPKSSEYISCGLTVVDSLDNCPPYEAISYVWGPPNPKETILCDSTPIEVTPNLARILKQLHKWRLGILKEDGIISRFKRFSRSKSHKPLPEFARHLTTTASTSSITTGYIWIDALCINQDDTQERSNQVSIMREIYHRARRVVVWLDGDNRELQAALSVLEVAWNNYYKERPIVKGEHTDYDPKVDMVKRDNNIARGFPDINDRAWKSLNTFLETAWFSRIWVIQEVAVSSCCVMLYGDIEVQWSAIGRSAYWLDRKGYSYVSQNLHGRTIAHLSLIWQLRTCRTMKNYRLSNLLRDSRGFAATLRHDKIYALLGLAATYDAEGARRPDYSKSADEVYQEITKSIIKEEQSLHVLTSVRHGDHVPENKPSWIPQWTWEESSGSMLSGGDINGTYNASQGRKVEFGNNTNMPVLSLKGIIVFTITHHSDAFEACDNYINHNSPLLPAWRMVKEVTAKITNPINLSQPIELIFTKLVTAGMDFARNRAGSNRQYWLDASEYWKNLGADDLEASCTTAAAMHLPNSSPSSALGMAGDLASFSHAVSFACDGRRLFVTQNGTLGIGPRALSQGDCIAILYGGSVPHVLRRRSKMYQLVGECFLDRYMDGEVVEMLQADKVTVQSIDLY